MATKKWLQTAVNPAKAGMFDKVSTESIQKELNHLRKMGPHKKNSKAFTRMHELNFALRARKNHGFSKK
jgi:hypothetical protein